MQKLRKSVPANRQTAVVGRGKFQCRTGLGATSCVLGPWKFPFNVSLTWNGIGCTIRIWAGPRLGTRRCFIRVSAREFPLGTATALVVVLFLGLGEGGWVSGQGIRQSTRRFVEDEDDQHDISTEEDLLGHLLPAHLAGTCDTSHIHNLNICLIWNVVLSSLGLPLLLSPLLLPPPNSSPDRSPDRNGLHVPRKSRYTRFPLRIGSMGPGHGQV